MRDLGGRDDDDVTVLQITELLRRAGDIVRVRPPRVVVYRFAERGDFRFQPAQGGVERNITLPTMSLLIEALRKRDEKASAV